MAQLKTLKFTSLPAVSDNPILTRRQKLMQRLEQQRGLAADPTYTRTVQRWTKKDGERVLTETSRKVHPWWRADASGSLVFFVRNGFKPIEFEKGKAGIAVASKAELPAIIDTLIKAAEQGELDEFLKEQTKPKSASRRKAA